MILLFFTPSCHAFMDNNALLIIFLFHTAMPLPTALQDALPSVRQSVIYGQTKQNQERSVMTFWAAVFAFVCNRSLLRCHQRATGKILKPIEFISASFNFGEKRNTKSIGKPTNKHGGRATSCCGALILFLLFLDY